MDFYEKRLSGKTLYEGKIINVEMDDIELPDGKPATREVVRHPGGVGVLAADGGGIYLVEQYRYPYAEAILEIPAGKLAPGEDSGECGARELREETGLTCAELVPLGQMYPSPGIMCERLHLYFAKGLKKGEAEPDEDEIVRVHVIPLDEVLQKIAADEIRDAKTITAIFRARLQGLI